MDIRSLICRPCRKLLLAVFFIPLFSNAQMLEVSGGTNINSLYSPEKEIIRSNIIDYRAIPGWSVAVKMSQFSKWGDPVVAVSIDKYNSTLSLNRFSKTTVSLGFYPVNLKIFKNLYFQAGPELSFLFNAKGQRTIFVPDITIPPTGYPFYGIPISYSDMWNQKIHLGAVASLSYKFQLKDGLYITPGYKYYNGLLMPEIEDISSKYYSRRHSFMISIGKKFNY